MAECRSCGAPIFWCVTVASGKRIPLDVIPTPAGNVQLATGSPARATVLAGNELAIARKRNWTLYRSHFATCPDAATWKKGTSDRTVEPAPADQAGVGGTEDRPGSADEHAGEPPA